MKARRNLPYNGMKKIILASASPGRKLILKRLKIKFKTVPSNYREDMRSGLKPRELAEFLSFKKAEAVAEKRKNSVVIAADTFIVLGGKLLGKPVTRTGAKKMLRKISGRSHLVVTGFTVMDSDSGQSVSKSAATKVHVKKLTPEEINAYVKSGEPMNKAGGYAIQELGSAIIEKINGDPSNIIGLPVCELVEILKKFGIRVL